MFLSHILFHSFILAALASTLSSDITLDRTPQKDDLLSSSSRPLSSPFAPDPQTLSANSNQTLHMTAVINRSDPPYTAHFQCWRLNDTFTTYPTVGRSIVLGNVDNVTYVVLPPRSAEGWHRPPHPMFFVLLSGVVQVYVPRFRDDGDITLLKDGHRRQPQRQQHTMNDLTSNSESPTNQPSPPDCPPSLDNPKWNAITITVNSPQQVLIAADTDLRAKGHLTFYPGDEETVALQIPLRGGGLGSSYTVVHEGACTGEE